MLFRSVLAAQNNHKDAQTAFFRLVGEAPTNLIFPHQQTVKNLSSLSHRQRAQVLYGLLVRVSVRAYRRTGRQLSNARTTFIKAGVEAGYASTDDYNASQQEGFGPMHMTVKNGVRSSASREYLDPVKSRSNLTVITGALAQKVILDGKKATGIEYKVNGNVQTAHAAKEVVLSAGPIGSPHILQLSGIGDKDILEKAGVEVKQIGRAHV